MPFVTLGPTSHDTLTGVSVDDHHDEAHNLAAHAVRAHANLSDAPADAHHATAHTAASHSDQGATGAELETLTDTSDADALHAHATKATQTSGTFTPGWADDTGSGSSEGQAYSSQVGIFRRIGDVVHVWIHILITDLGTLTAGQNLRLVGLPVAAVNTSNQFGSIHAMDGQSMAIGAGEGISGDIGFNTSFAFMRKWDAVTGSTTLIVSELSVGAELRMYGCYQAAP